MQPLVSEYMSYPSSWRSEKMDLTVLREHLVGLEIFEGGEIAFSPLKGGVSSDIYLMQKDDKKYVLKQALSQLRVEEEWLADVSRNLAEQDFIHYVSSFASDNVPQIIHADRQNAFFLMPYYGPPYQNWKAMMMDGKKSIQVTRQVAGLLAQIHTQSYHNESLKDRFNHTNLFFELRVEPYILFTGSKYPQWRHVFDAEAHRLLEHSETLMHGDFSPKNILVHENHVLLLDHEVACYGDPAFDVAFMLNHLLLKRLVFSNQEPKDPLLPKVFWDQYFQDLDIKQVTALKSRTIHLLKLLMLARVDGKSPAEYLDHTHKDWIRKIFKKSIDENFQGKFDTYLDFFDEYRTDGKN